MHSITVHKMSCIHIHFLNCFQPLQFNRGNIVDVVNCHKFFSRVIGVSVFDILQIHSGFSQICSGCIASTCTPLATGLLTLLYSAVPLPLMALTLYLLTWRIWWAPTNVSKGQMGFNSAFKGLIWPTSSAKQRHIPMKSSICQETEFCW
jgi:hypothetical protein